MGEFWDKHDFTEFDDPNAPDIDFHVTAAISIEPDLLSDIEELAHQRGINVETLVNLWLKEKSPGNKSWVKCVITKTQARAKRINWVTK